MERRTAPRLTARSALPRAEPHRKLPVQAAPAFEPAEGGESLRSGGHSRTHRPAGESASGPAPPSRPGSLLPAYRSSNTAVRP